MLQCGPVMRLPGDVGDVLVVENTTQRREFAVSPKPRHHLVLPGPDGGALDVH
jgi:hypothetical protein